MNAAVMECPEEDQDEAGSSETESEVLAGEEAADTHQQPYFDTDFRHQGPAREPSPAKYPRYSLTPQPENDSKRRMRTLAQQVEEAMRTPSLKKQPQEYADMEFPDSPPADRSESLDFADPRNGQWYQLAQGRAKYVEDIQTSEYSPAREEPGILEEYEEAEKAILQRAARKQGPSGSAPLFDSSESSELSQLECLEELPSELLNDLPRAAATAEVKPSAVARHDRWSGKPLSRFAPETAHFPQRSANPWSKAISPLAQPAHHTEPDVAWEGQIGKASLLQTNNDSIDSDKTYGAGQAGFAGNTARCPSPSEEDADMHSTAEMPEAALTPQPSCSPHVSTQEIADEAFPDTHKESGMDATSGSRPCSASGADSASCSSTASLHEAAPLSAHEAAQPKPPSSATNAAEKSALTKSEGDITSLLACCSLNHSILAGPGSFVATTQPGNGGPHLSDAALVPAGSPGSSRAASAQLRGKSLLRQPNSTALGPRPDPLPADQSKSAA